MKSECNIVQDLLPLCVEDMASPDSAVFVGKHLEKCEVCRKEMSLLKNASRLDQAIPDPSEAEALLALKEQIKRRNKILVTARTIISTVILSALLIALIVYHFPQRRRVCIPVCSVTGEASTLEIDVKYYRRLFSIPWMKGTLTFNGDTYRDVATYRSRQSEGVSFWDWVWYFGDPDSVIPSNRYFENVEYDPSKTFQDEIMITYLGEGNSFDMVSFLFLQFDESEQDTPKYFGPASTIEEAKKLAKDQGWQVD